MTDRCYWCDDPILIYYQFDDLQFCSEGCADSYKYSELDDNCDWGD